MNGSYELVCNYCDYRDVFRFGLGFLYNWDMLFDLHKDNDLLRRLVVNDENYITVKDLILKHHAMVSPDYGHDIYRCRQCNTFHEGFYIRLDYDNGFFEPMYMCPECHVILDRTEFDESDVCTRWQLDMLHDKYPCPDCGELALKREFNL